MQQPQSRARFRATAIELSIQRGVELGERQPEGVRLTFCPRFDHDHGLAAQSDLNSTRRVISALGSVEIFEPHDYPLHAGFAAEHAREPGRD